MSKEVFVDHDLLHVHSCETGSVLYKPHVSHFPFFLFLLLICYLQLMHICLHTFSLLYVEMGYYRWDITY